MHACSRALFFVLMGNCLGIYVPTIRIRGNESTAGRYSCLSKTYGNIRPDIVPTPAFASNAVENYMGERDGSSFPSENETSAFHSRGDGGHDNPGFLISNRASPMVLDEDDDDCNTSSERPHLFTIDSVLVADSASFAAPRIHKTSHSDDDLEWENHCLASIAYPSISDAGNHANDSETPISRWYRPLSLVDNDHQRQTPHLDANRNNLLSPLSSVEVTLPQGAVSPTVPYEQGLRSLASSPQLEWDADDLMDHDTEQLLREIDRIQRGFL